ncbi:HPt (histidine-containing phosphotransfer) domain-containing protein [Sinomonas atrocyanea]|uniref:Hpt domain-containing protein n=1 Tax=Sinomonas atrocyanea TaxID=37927 RepID=UPI002789933F|nr:HPt (histidine-containing phosphotransfer) domain-containing protein [Sinomonas atrocyanea]
MGTKQTVVTAPGRVSERAGGVQPLVDPAALQGLAEDVGPETAASFSRAFVRLWPRRRDSLIAALGQDDYGAAHDAALSLRSSSAMVGASRLAGLAGQLERCLRAEGTVAAARFLPSILECGPPTLLRLSNDSSVSIGGPGELQ